MCIRDSGNTVQLDGIKCDNGNISSDHSPSNNSVTITPMAPCINNCSRGVVHRAGSTMRFSDAVAGLVTLVLLCAASSCVVDAVHNGEAVSTSATVADAAQAIRALKLHATKHLAKHAAKRHAARALASYEAASKSMRALYDKAKSKLLEAASVSSGFALRARSTYRCGNLVSKRNMCCVRNMSMYSTVSVDAVDAVSLTGIACI